MPFTPAALLVIKNEINTDPATRGYSGQTNDQITTLINELLAQSPQVFLDNNISLQEVALELVRRNKWEDVTTAAATIAAAGHSDAFAIVEASKLTTVLDQVNTSTIRTAILNLISAGVLNSADGNALQTIARSEVKQSRAQIVVGTSIGIGDVVAALAS